MTARPMTTTRARRAREKRIRWIRKTVEAHGASWSMWSTLGAAEGGGQVFAAPVGTALPDAKPINTYGIDVTDDELGIGVEEVKVMPTFRRFR